MVSKGGKQHLVFDNPDLAITDYLDALLKEVDESKEPDSEDSIEARVVVLAEEKKAVQRTDVSASIVQLREHAGSGMERPAAADMAQALRPSEAELPAWAKKPFQCLLIKVSGLKLAVPLILLNSISQWRDNATSLPGQPDWQVGIIEHRGAKVRIVDTAMLVMPEKVRLKSVQDRAKHAAHVLIIGDGQWGLLCDHLLNPIMLDPEKVEWRISWEKRPWVAGALPDQLCILLDVEALLDMIGHE